MSEEAEIKYKRSDFVGRTNSLIANFKCVDRSTASVIFRSQCCHFYGCQAWSLESKYITKFDVAWRKAVRKLWFLPNITRSAILPGIVNMNTVQDQAITRFVKMYNNVMKGKNNRMVLLCKISVYSESKGIIGRNVELISRIARCTYDYLSYTRRLKCTDENITRATAVTELTACLEGSQYIDNFDKDDIKIIRDYIACF